MLILSGLLDDDKCCNTRSNASHPTIILGFFPEPGYLPAFVRPRLGKRRTHEARSISLYENLCFSPPFDNTEVSRFDNPNFSPSLARTSSDMAASDSIASKRIGYDG